VVWITALQTCDASFDMGDQSFDCQKPRQAAPAFLPPRLVPQHWRPAQKCWATLRIAPQIATVISRHPIEFGHPISRSCRDGMAELDLGAGASGEDVQGASSSGEALRHPAARKRRGRGSTDSVEQTGVPGLLKRFSPVGLEYQMWSNCSFGAVVRFQWQG
jgi:hypothetical protein